eukprot:g43845.t1
MPVESLTMEAQDKAQIQAEAQAQPQFLPQAQAQTSYQASSYEGNYEMQGEYANPTESYFVHLFWREGPDGYPMFLNNVTSTSESKQE